MKPYIKYFLLPLLLFFAGVVFCFFYIVFQRGNMFFYVLPHHNLTDKNTNEAYKNIAKKSPNIENIVIISPNHFENRNQVTFPVSGTYCYKNSCVQGETLENDKFLDFTVQKENENYHITEHGVGNHFTFIKKYFPKARVYPLLLQIQTEFSDEVLLQFLKNYHFDGNTLVIASVDFSHHTQEKIAQIHDMETLYFLQHDTSQKVEVDCPNCLGLIKVLAQAKKKPYFHFFKRTSVDTILGGNSNYENTSHIFGEFLPYKQQASTNFLKGFHQRSIDYIGEPISFVVVPKIENTESLTCFYSHKNIKRNPKFWHNRLLYGIDFGFTEKNNDISSDLYEELGFSDTDRDIFEKYLTPIRKTDNKFVLGYMYENILYYQTLAYDVDKHGTIICDSFK